MKIVGLVTEYNPFHNGHKYHLNASKKITNCEYSVSVMSGNFLQRGEPALTDKWTRAKMAIDNGVDLVLELPTIFACQSAEHFAYGSIKLLDSLDVVDSVCFGSEWGNIDELSEISKILINEPDIFKVNLKSYLSKGYPFPKARSYGLLKYFESKNIFNNEIIQKILISPNNILAIEYLKALLKLKSNIKPFTIKRIIADYNSEDLTGKISSATSIRKSIFNSNIDSIKNTIPNNSFKYIEDFYEKFNEFNRLENFDQIVNYLLTTIHKEDLENIVDIDSDLANRIFTCKQSNNNIKNILDCLKTKRYTYTRLQRVIIHILLKLTKDKFEYLYEEGPKYIRVLGSNNKGLEILNKIKYNSSLPIITKFSNFADSNDNKLREMLSIDKISTDIYYLGLSKNFNKINLDYINSPYIKKK